MIEKAKARLLLPGLFLLAAIPRVLAAFLLPNAFGDAYVYIADIGRLSSRIANGSFRPTDLFGFWLPLYQFLSALLNVFVKNGFYSGKLVSAAFGTGVCLFVYAITLRLTANRTAAVLMFLLIALNPLHIFYSASAMTDVPHAFFVLAALYFVITRRWICAAVFAALAGLTRVESWMLIVLIPVIQLFQERRISVTGLLIMIVPPVFWFYISWKATGNWRACFEQRQQYHDWLLAQNPALAHFTFGGVIKDSAIFLFSSDLAVLGAAFVAGWFVLRSIVRAKHHAPESEKLRAVTAPVVFFFSFFVLLVGAYLTHQQPIIFPRYALVLFSLGIPILAWAYLTFAKRNSASARKLLIVIIAVCVFDASVQLLGSVGVLNQISVQRATADYLRDHFDPKSDARIFCDEGTVRVMSGIPEERFLTSADAPRDREGFLSFVREHNIQYLILANQTDARVPRLFPKLLSGTGDETFRPVFHIKVGFLRTEIWVIQVAPDNVLLPAPPSGCADGFQERSCDAEPVDNKDVRGYVIAASSQLELPKLIFGNLTIPKPH